MNLAPSKIPADNLLPVFRQLWPRQFPDELWRWPLRGNEFPCANLDSARFSLGAANRQYQKGWLTELEHRAISARCLTAIKKFGG